MASILQLCSDDLFSPLANKINSTPRRGKNVTIDNIGQDDNIKLTHKTAKIPRQQRHNTNNHGKRIVINISGLQF